MKYSIITFGCRVNQADSLGFEERLRMRGAVEAAPESADLIIVNTCSVTASADQSARQTVRRLARQNAGARIVVTGCYATRRPDELRDLPNVLKVVPNSRKSQLVDELSSDLGLTTSERFGDGEGSCGAAIEPGIAGRTAFTLRVQTGCAQPCAYCIIPATRGDPKSVPLAEVVSEVGRVAEAGFKEVVLTGVHLGSYGRNLHPRASIAELLGALAECATGRARAGGAFVSFRISSLEPMDCSREVVDLVAAHECFAPHFHLPLQHASERVLGVMRRPYTVAHYAALVDDIRVKMPHAAIGTDVIVGFPGETDEDFDQLASYLDRSPLTYVHVFPYSDRPGTPAAGLANKIGGADIRERGRRVREIAERLTDRFRSAQLGTIHRALTLADGSLAVTGNYLKVKIPPGRSRNEWVRVRIETTGGAMSGTLVDA